MANQAGTILGVTELRAKSQTSPGGPARKAYLVSLSFPASANGDTASVANVSATIGTHLRAGKTMTLRGAVPIAAAWDSTNAQDVYFTGTAVEALTVSSDSLTGQLSTIAGGALTSGSAAVTGVEICVICDEQ